MLTSILLVPGSRAEECSAGCLRCEVTTNAVGGSSASCLICDAMMGYILQNGRCVQQSISNCLISFEPDTCHHCEYSYFLTGEFKCMQIDRHSSLAIKSCNHYAQADTCRVCDMNTYARNGVCRPVFQKTRHCTLYDSSKTCEMCDLMLTSNDGTSCHRVPEDEFDHCLLFRHPLTCKKCKSGFRMNENKYMDSLLEFDNLKRFMFHLKFWRDQLFSIVYNTPVCEALPLVENCAEMNNDGTCAACEVGYTLSPDKQSCFIKPSPPLNPKDRIPNCFIFDSANYEQCDICYEGFYLGDNSTKCREHETVVPNCIIHSQTQAARCVYCDNKYYLDEETTDINSICVERQNFFNNCYTYNRTADECLGCADEHLFHDENKKCSLRISNCEMHDITDVILKCEKCEAGFYLNEFSTECINANGVVSGCLRYGPNAVCEECQQSFYLDELNNLCRLQERFIGCKEMSVTEQDVCDECDGNGIRTVMVSTCTQVDDLTLAEHPQCISYDEDRICTQCNQDWVLHSTERDGKSIIECIRFVGCAALKDITDHAKCGQCRSEYYLFNDGCHQPNSADCIYSYDNYNITVYNFGINNTGPCELCDENLYYNVIVATQKEQRCITFHTRISNCINYTLNDSLELVCAHCRRGYVTSADKKTCNELNSGFIYSYDLMEQYSTSKAGFSTDQCAVVDSTESYCLVCKADMVTIYSFDDASGSKGILELIDEADKHSFKKYLLPSDDNAKPLNEAFYMQEAVAVQTCYDDESTNNYSSIRYKATVEDQAYYLCDKGHLVSANVNFHVSGTDLLVENTDENFSVDDDYSVYWKTTDEDKHGAVCSTDLLDNCATHIDDRTLQLGFKELFYLSCAECDEGHSLTYSIYDATVTYQSTVSEFKWIINECQQLVTFDDIPVDNCFMYHKYMRVEDWYYECKYCRPRYTPTEGLVTRRCLQSDEFYSDEDRDRCVSHYMCNEWQYCEPDCSDSCTEDEYCTANSECASKFCTDCDNSDPNTCEDGCPLDKLCKNSVCYNRCECGDDQEYQCDASTGYECWPMICTAGSEPATDNYVSRTDTIEAFNDGVASRINSDGSITRTRDDGTEQTIHPDDGKIITKFTDRVTTFHGKRAEVGDYPEPATGLDDVVLKKETANFDGSITESFPSGYERITYPDDEKAEEDYTFDIINPSGEITTTEISGTHKIVTTNDSGVRTVEKTIEDSGDHVSTEAITLAGVSTLTKANGDEIVTYLNDKQTIDRSDGITGIDQVIDPVRNYVVDYLSNKKIVKFCDETNTHLVESVVTYDPAGSENNESQIEVKDFGDNDVTKTIKTETKTASTPHETTCKDDGGHDVGSYFEPAYYKRTDYVFSDDTTYTVYHEHDTKESVYTDDSGNIRTVMKDNGDDPYITVEYYDKDEDSTLNKYSDGSTVKLYNTGDVEKVETSATGVITTTYRSGKVTVEDGATFTTTIFACIEVYNTDTDEGTFSCDASEVAESSFDSGTSTKTITKDADNLTFDDAVKFNRPEVEVTIFIDNTTAPVETTTLHSDGKITIESTSILITKEGNTVTTYDKDTEITTITYNDDASKKLVIDADGNRTETGDVAGTTNTYEFVETVDTDESSETFEEIIHTMRTITNADDEIIETTESDLLTKETTTKTYEGEVLQTTRVTQENGDYHFENHITGEVTIKEGQKLTQKDSEGNKTARDHKIKEQTIVADNTYIETTYFADDETVRIRKTFIYDDVLTKENLLSETIFDNTTDPPTTTEKESGEVTEVTYGNTVETHNGNEYTIITYTDEAKTDELTKEEGDGTYSLFTDVPTGDTFRKDFNSGVLEKTTDTKVSPSITTVNEFDADGAVITKSTETIVTTNGSLETTVETVTDYAYNDAGNEYCVTGKTVETRVVDTDTNEDQSLRRLTYTYDGSYDLDGKTEELTTYQYDGATRKKETETTTVDTLNATTYTASSRESTKVSYDTDEVKVKETVTNTEYMLDGSTKRSEVVDETEFDAATGERTSQTISTVNFFIDGSAIESEIEETITYTNDLKSGSTKTTTSYDELAHKLQEIQEVYTYDANEAVLTSTETTTDYDLSTVIKTITVEEDTFDTTDPTILKEKTVNKREEINDIVSTVTNEKTTYDTDVTEKLTYEKKTEEYDINGVKTSEEIIEETYSASTYNLEKVVTTTNEYVLGVLESRVIATDDYDTDGETKLETTVEKTYYTNGTLVAEPELDFKSNIDTTAPIYTYTIVDYYQDEATKAFEYTEKLEIKDIEDSGEGTVQDAQVHSYELTTRNSGNEHIYHKEYSEAVKSDIGLKHYSTMTRKYDGADFVQEEYFEREKDSLLGDLVIDYNKVTTIYHTTSDTADLRRSYVLDVNTQATDGDEQFVDGTITFYEDDGTTAKEEYDATDELGNGEDQGLNDITFYYVGGTKVAETDSSTTITYGKFPTVAGYDFLVESVEITDRNTNVVIYSDGRKYELTNPSGNNYTLTYFADEADAGESDTQSKGGTNLRNAVFELATYGDVTFEGSNDNDRIIYTSVALEDIEAYVTEPLIVRTLDGATITYEFSGDVTVVQGQITTKYTRATGATSVADADANTTTITQKHRNRPETIVIDDNTQRKTTTRGGYEKVEDTTSDWFSESYTVNGVDIEYENDDAGKEILKKTYSDGSVITNTTETNGNTLDEESYGGSVFRNTQYTADTDVKKVDLSYGPDLQVTITHTGSTQVTKEVTMDSGTIYTSSDTDTGDSEFSSTIDGTTITKDITGATGVIELSNSASNVAQTITDTEWEIIDSAANITTTYQLSELADPFYTKDSPAETVTKHAIKTVTAPSDAALPTVTEYAEQCETCLAFDCCGKSIANGPCTLEATAATNTKVYSFSVGEGISVTKTVVDGNETTIERTGEDKVTQYPDDSIEHHSDSEIVRVYTNGQIDKFNSDRTFKLRTNVVDTDDLTYILDIEPSLDPLSDIGTMMKYTVDETNADGIKRITAYFTNGAMLIRFGDDSANDEFYTKVIEEDGVEQFYYDNGRTVEFSTDEDGNEVRKTTQPDGSYRKVYEDGNFIEFYDSDDNLLRTERTYDDNDLKTIDYKHETATEITDTGVTPCDDPATIDVLEIDGAIYEEATCTDGKVYKYYPNGNYEIDEVNGDRVVYDASEETTTTTFANGDVRIDYDDSTRYDTIIDGVTTINYEDGLIKVTDSDGVVTLYHTDQSVQVIQPDNSYVWTKYRLDNGEKQLAEDDKEIYDVEEEDTDGVLTETRYEGTVIETVEHESVKVSHISGFESYLDQNTDILKITKEVPGDPASSYELTITPVNGAAITYDKAEDLFTVESGTTDTTIMPGVYFDIAEDGSSTQSNMFKYINRTRIPGADTKTVFGDGRELEMLNDTSTRERYPNGNLYETKPTTNTDDSVAVSTFTNTSDSVVVKAFHDERRETTLENADVIRVEVDGNVLITFDDDPERVSLAIDRNEIETTTYKNGEVTVLNPNHIVPNGCPSSNQICMYGSCYNNYACDCEKGTYCELDDSVDNQIHTTCVAGNSTCEDCQSDGDYCIKNPDNGTLACSADKQQYYYEATTCNCDEGETCVDGQCRPSDPPCYHSLDDTIAIYCSSDERCKEYEPGSFGCFKTCIPECEPKYECILEEGAEFMTCSILPKVFSDEYVITECNEIANCEESSRLNTCEKCESGYAFLAEGTAGNYTPNPLSCVPVFTDNCYAAIASDDTYVCVECKPGYDLSGSICFISVSNCSSFDDSGDCEWCDVTYSDPTRILVYAKYDEGGCTPYPTGAPLPDNVKHPTESINCRYFEYVIESSAQIQPLTAGSSKCVECNFGYFLNNDDKCLPRSIDNCETYSVDSDTGSIWCEECSIGYRSTSDPAKIGALGVTECLDNTPPFEDYHLRIPACNKYRESTGCALCYEGYMLKEAKENSFGQKFYCFSDVKEENCTLTDVGHFFNTGALKCKTCQRIQGRHAYPKPSIRNLCLGIPYRPDCIDHSATQFDESTLECLQCADSYYLDVDTNSCFLRTNTNIANCKKYSLTEDDCEEFFEDEDEETIFGDNLPTDVQKLLNSPPVAQTGPSAVDFRGWIMGCEIYEDSQTCSRCYAPKYLNELGFDYNTICLTVIRETPHCKYYATDGITCEVCQDFYKLVEGECRLVTVENCADENAINSCIECPKTHPYLDNDQNCSKVLLNPWCHEYTESEEIHADTLVECETCEEGFYRDDVGICRLLETVIPNCKYYSGKTLCKQCREGFYLDHENKRCLINPSYDENCAEFEYSTECAVCDFGYYMKDGECEACGTDGSCAFCDPGNPSRCLMCRFGYTHDGNNCAETSEGSGEVEYLRKFNYNTKIVQTELSRINRAIPLGIPIGLLLLIAIGHVL